MCGDYKWNILCGKIWFYFKARGGKSTKYWGKWILHKGRWEKCDTLCQEVNKKITVIWPAHDKLAKYTIIHCTITLVTHWWSRVARLAHQDRRTQNCWSWRSRGECSRHYSPHRGWYLNDRRGDIHRWQTVWVASLKSVSVFSFSLVYFIWWEQRNLSLQHYCYSRKWRSLPS